MNAPLMRVRMPLACGLLLALPITQKAAAAPTSDVLASHPRDLRYAELKFEVPKAEKYRFKLKNGIVAYVAEDHTLPLVKVTVIVRSGSFLEPKDRPGLAALVGTLMRTGGTATLTAEQFDEKADFLAAEISCSGGGGGYESRASLDAISQQLDPSLDLFFEMLKTPRFQDSRLAVEKGNILEAMKQRNDDADDILGREWSWLIYGEDHFTTRRSKKTDVDAMTRQDLIDFHKKFWRPENMMITVAGDVDAKEILAKLDQRFAGWQPEGPKIAWPPPAPSHEPKPGLYHVEKDIPQGKVLIGHLGTKYGSWDNPDYACLAVMNDILGGGGFTSRIMKRVRSDEGLAYGASSSFGIGPFWPGQFRITFQSKNPTVAYAAKISIDEVKRIRDTLVSDEELTTSKNSFIETFPRDFESASKIADRFANDDFIGRPHSYWEKYRDNIRKVTPTDVQRVAKSYLQPEKLVFLVVGKWSEIEPGDADKKASMKEFFGGKVTHLPLRDPLTLQPLP